MATATMAAPAIPAVWKPHHNPWAVALTVTLATFMEVLDTSIANVALPHMAGSLGASQEEATWVLTSYLVSSAIVLPISGWLSNRFGRKRFYMTCVALFTICCFLCGIANTFPLLIIARILQEPGGRSPQRTSHLAYLPVERRGLRRLRNSRRRRPAIGPPSAVGSPTTSAGTESSS
jgi:DHA2 family multidrug resistance protein